MKIRNKTNLTLLPTLPIINKSIKKKKETKRKSTSSLASIKNPTIVPWSSTSEWDRACHLFRENDYDDLLDLLLVWTGRVAQLPVGVEGTLCLVQAFGFDSKCNQFHPEEQLQARSLYSLALIRFLNHVSQLASSVMGGVGLPMTQLASHVSIPSWLVEMRHEATHGGHLPPLESLRNAATFINTWLQENYWIGSGGKLPLDILSVPHPYSLDDELIVGEDEKSLFVQNVSGVISAYVASRVYHLRQAITITDSELTRWWPNSPRSIPTKAALRSLKQTMNQFLSSEPSVTCSTLAVELIPPPDFYSEFCLAFPNGPMRKLRLVWTPILKLIQRRGELGTLCGELVQIHSRDPCPTSQRFSALWIRVVVGMMKRGNVDYSSQLHSEILPMAMKSLNPHSHLFIKRFLCLLKGKVGLGGMKKLRLLVEIWREPVGTADGDLHRKSTCLMSLDEILESTSQNQRKETLMTGDMDMNTRQKSNLDPRGSDFWERIPLGHFFSSLSS